MTFDVTHDDSMGRFLLLQPLHITYEVAVGWSSCVSSVCLNRRAYLIAITDRMRRRIRKKHDVGSIIDFIAIVEKRKYSDMCGVHDRARARHGWRLFGVEADDT